jgi:hypothetical protein
VHKFGFILWRIPFAFGAGQKLSVVIGAVNGVKKVLYIIEGNGLYLLCKRSVVKEKNKDCE